MSFYINLPVWLRWVLLIPLTVVGAVLAGIFIYVLGAKLAVQPDAPIIYIVEFFRSLVTDLVAFYIIYKLSPSHRKQLLIAIALISAVANISLIYNYFVVRDYLEMIGVIGQIVAIGIAWKKFIHVE